MEWHDLVMRLRPRTYLERQMQRRVENCLQDVAKKSLGIYKEENGKDSIAVVYEWKSSEYEQIVM